MQSNKFAATQLVCCAASSLVENSTGEPAGLGELDSCFVQIQQTALPLFVTLPYPL